MEPAFCDQIQPIPVGLEASEICLPESGFDSCPVGILGWARENWQRKAN